MEDTSSSQCQKLKLSDLADFYDRMYANEGMKAMRTLEHYQEMFAFIQPVRKGGKLLDIGCGTGYFLKTASEAGLDSYGIDISQVSVDLSKKTAPLAHVACSPGEHLQFESKSFDYIFFGGTLEHFLDPDKGLEEAYRVAKDDAEFLIVVPNKNYWLWRVRGEHGTNQREVQELLQNYDSWVGMFKRHGIVPVGVTHDPWPWKSVKIFKKKNPWNIARRIIYRFIWLFIPLRHTYQFVFVCKKIA